MWAGRPSRVVSVLFVCGPGLPICSTNLPSRRELEDVTVLLAVRREPDEALVVDVDAVLVLRPVVALARAAPGLDEIALRVELHHRRGGLAALRARRVEGRGLLVVGQRLRPLHDPDVVLRVDGDAGGLAHDPAVRERLRPGGVDLEFRDFAGFNGGREAKC